MGSRIRKPDALWVCVHSRNAGGEHGSRPEGEQLGGQVRSPYRYTDGLQSYPCLQFVHVGTPPCSRNISQLPFPACQSDPSYTGVVCMDIYLTYAYTLNLTTHAPRIHISYPRKQLSNAKCDASVTYPFALLPTHFIIHSQPPHPFSPNLLLPPSLFYLSPFPSLPSHTRAYTFRNARCCAKKIDQAN